MVDTADSEIERFIAQHFRSEEELTIVMALRGLAAPVTPGEVIERLRAEYAFADENTRVVQKRIELRMRDLESGHLVRRAGQTTFQYAADDSADAIIARISDVFRTRRKDIERMIYSPASSARRFAEAFRL